MKRPSPSVGLAVICASTFTINLATTAVNVALPALVTDLGATTRELQWIVDAYNLTFATFVLAFGSLSDRYGRKGALLAGLAVFGGGALGAAQAGSTAQLIGWQAVMGLGAALVFPTTLSLLSNLFTERVARARAIGIWGATTGLGVACGPILSGALLENGPWGRVWVALAACAGLALLASTATVTTSRDPATPRIDTVGLALSVLGVGGLVYTVIEAPSRGWLSAGTLGGFAGAALVLALFVGWERRRAEPMLDVRLFRNLRFTAASASVTFAFFALFGFIFLITQYFQFVRDYSPLSTGLRILPVALSIAVGSVVGVALAVRIGNKIVVAAGLLCFTAAFLWVATVGADTSYAVIAAQMVPLGLGLGLTSAPATEAIMGVVPAEKAGIGSAMNDATRELGGTLGVAVIGSVYASLYATGLAASPAVALLPADARALAGESIGAAQIVGERIAQVAGAGAARAFTDAATAAFLDGLTAGCLVAAGVTALGAVVAAVYLPARPPAPAVTR